MLALLPSAPPLVVRSSRSPFAQSGMTAGDALRVVTLGLHFASSIFLLVVSFRCSGGLRLITQTYTESVTDQGGYALVMNQTCSDLYSKECFYGLKQAYDVVQHSLEWNVFALLAVFEWLSASFALTYLGEQLERWWSLPRATTTWAVVAWNVVGLLTLMPYSMQLSTLQAGVTALALIAATVSQLTEGIPVPSGAPWSRLVRPLRCNQTARWSSLQQRT